MSFQYKFISLILLTVGLWDCLYVQELRHRMHYTTDLKKLDAMLAFTRANMEKSRCSKTRKGEWRRGMDIVTRGYKFQHVNLIMFFYI